MIFNTNDIAHTLSTQRGTLAPSLHEIINRPRVRRGELKVGDHVLSAIADPRCPSEDDLIDAIDAR